MSLNDAYSSSKHDSEPKPCSVGREHRQTQSTRRRERPEPISRGEVRMEPLRLSSRRPGTCERSELRGSSFASAFSVSFVARDRSCGIGILLVSRARGGSHKGTGRKPREVAESIGAPSIESMHAPCGPTAPGGSGLRGPDRRHSPPAPAWPRRATRRPGPPTPAAASTTCSWPSPRRPSRGSQAPQEIS